MEEFEDSEAYFDEQRSKFFDAMIPLFDFSSFHAGNIIDYAQTLLRISGMEVGGWDPYAESRNILEDLNGFFKIDLPEERFPNRVYTDWRIGLLMYCHIVEMEAPLEVLTNLVRLKLSMRYHPNPYFDFLTTKEKKEFKNYGIKTPKKIEILRRAGKKAGLSIAEIFDEFYDKDVRNAVQHSSFILTDEDFRWRNSVGNDKYVRMPYPVLNAKLTKAKAFISAFFGHEYAVRHIIGEERRRPILFDLHYKALLEILVDDEELTCGVSIHWPNNSESVMKRTIDGLEVKNFIPGSRGYEPMVGIYARKPGEFGPLVEAGQEPRYTRFANPDTKVEWPDDVDAYMRRE